MRHFEDNQGQKWAIDIHMPSMDDVLKETGIDLLSWVSSDPSSLNDVASNHRKVLSIIHALCREQIDQREITDTDFFKRLTGDAIPDAIDAIMEGLIDFLPKHQATIWRKAWEKTKTVQEEVIEMANKSLDDQRVDQMIRSRLKQFDETFTAYVDSWESHVQTSEPTEI